MTMKKSKNLLQYFIDHNIKTLVKIVSLIVKLTTDTVNLSLIIKLKQLSYY